MPWTLKRFRSVMCLYQRRIRTCQMSNSKKLACSPNCFPINDYHRLLDDDYLQKIKEKILNFGIGNYRIGIFRKIIKDNNNVLLILNLE